MNEIINNALHSIVIKDVQRKKKQNLPKTLPHGTINEACIFYLLLRSDKKTTNLLYITIN